MVNFMESQYGILVRNYFFNFLNVIIIQMRIVMSPMQEDQMFFKKNHLMQFKIQKYKDE
jgi:hypothetical protein